MSWPRNLIVPEVASISRTSDPDQGRLAAARLADDPERLALVELKRDVVDRVHLPDLAVDDHARS